MAKLPDSAVELLQQPFLAHVGTSMPDGSPQVTPVWVDTDGEHILINTAEGRTKTRNVRRNPNVAVSVVDPENPLAGALQVRGTVVEINHRGGGSAYRQTFVQVCWGALRPQRGTAHPQDQTGRLDRRRGCRFVIHGSPASAPNPL